MPSYDAHLVSYGVPFRLRASTALLLDRMLEAVPHNTIPAPPGPTAQIFTLPSDDPATLSQLRTDLMVHVANFAPGHVFLHAGVVALHGRALVLPGPSFAGKTTLTAALVRAGATYYSDEYAVLDPLGRVHPYARSLQVRTPGLDDQRPFPVEHLHGTSGTQPLPAALVAFVEYLPSAVWSPLPITPGLAILEMLRHNIPVQRTPARVLAPLTAFVAPARLLQAHRNEAEEAAHHLLTLLAEPRS